MHWLKSQQARCSRLHHMLCASKHPVMTPAMLQLKSWRASVRHSSTSACQSQAAARQLRAFLLRAALVPCIDKTLSKQALTNITCHAAAQTSLTCFALTTLTIVTARSSGMVTRAIVRRSRERQYQSRQQVSIRGHHNSCNSSSVSSKTCD